MKLPQTYFSLTICGQKYILHHNWLTTDLTLLIVCVCNPRLHDRVHLWGDRQLVVVTTWSIELPTQVTASLPSLSSKVPEDRVVVILQVIPDFGLCARFMNYDQRASYSNIVISLKFFPQLVARAEWKMQQSPSAAGEVSVSLKTR